MGAGSVGSNNSNCMRRREPRTKIKTKQLEVLRAAFAATPKPNRLAREQLARDTGLNMRVIQVHAKLSSKVIKKERDRRKRTESINQNRSLIIKLLKI
jgi:hypothetical protein